MKKNQPSGFYCFFFWGGGSSFFFNPFLCQKSNMDLNFLGGNFSNKNTRLWPKVDFQEWKVIITNRHNNALQSWYWSIRRENWKNPLLLNSYMDLYLFFWGSRWGGVKNIPLGFSWFFGGRGFTGLIFFFFNDIYIKNPS